MNDPGSIPVATTSDDRRVASNTPPYPTGQQVAKPHCTDCRYFHDTTLTPSDYFPPDGECHWHPPTADRTWPRVRGDDWCGMHCPAVPVQP